MKRPKGFMDLNLVKKITDELKEKGVRTSYAHQIGEPLLNEKIFEMVALISKAGIRTSISTNGILLKKRRDEILNSKLNELTIALDGINKDVYEFYRKGARFEEVLYNTFDFLSEWGLRKNKIHVQLQSIIMTRNQNQLENIEKTFSKFKNRGSFEILFKQYSTFGGEVPDLGGKTPPRRFNCKKPWTDMTVHQNGWVVHCCRSYDPFLVLGDLNKESVYEVWNGKKYQELRRKFKEGRFNEIPLCGKC